MPPDVHFSAIGRAWVAEPSPGVVLEVAVAGDEARARLLDAFGVVADVTARRTGWSVDALDEGTTVAAMLFFSWWRAQHTTGAAVTVERGADASPEPTVERGLEAPAEPTLERPDALAELVDGLSAVVGLEGLWPGLGELEVAEPEVASAVSHVEPAPPKRRQRKGAPRALGQQLTDLEVAEAVPADDLPARPRTRGECASGPRPCPWVGCRYHLLLEVSAGTGAIMLTHGHTDPTLLAETCALDLADRGEHTLEEVAVCFDVSREAVRQIETRAFKKLDRKSVGLRRWLDTETDEPVRTGRGG